MQTLQHPGKTKGPVSYSVGVVPGLRIQVSTKHVKSWVLRYSAGTQLVRDKTTDELVEKPRVREFGLGVYPDIGLAEARGLARNIKAKVKEGFDPIEDKKSKIAEAETERAKQEADRQRKVTFREATDRYLPVKFAELSNEKHKAQWRSTLEQYAFPHIGDMLVQDINRQDILRVLQPIWTSKHETATRVRSRIQSVLDWSDASGFRVGDNPAEWTGGLKKLLPNIKKSKIKENQPALKLDDLHRWIGGIRSQRGSAKYALEFVLLTAARSGEVRGATWAEIDFENQLWVIPKERMKADRPHRVPLTRYMLEILETMKPENPEPRGLIFPAPRGGTMSDMTLTKACRRLHDKDISGGGQGFIDAENGRPIVPHGLRSTFRDWVADKTSFNPQLAEMALAHKVANQTEAAYRRGDMVKRRRPLMEAWNHFINQSADDSKVIPLNA